MANLKDVISDASVGGGKYNNPVGGKKKPKGKYIALVLVPKNILPDWGGSYTPAGGGSATVVSGSTIVGLLTTLAFAGQAWFLGNRLINGKRGKPEEMKNTSLYGTQTDVLPTGEIKEKIEVEVNWFYHNRDFFNTLRYNFAEFDQYWFTDISVELVRYDDCSPVFSNIGDETPGDVNKDIAGSFTVSYSNEGQVLPQFGVVESSLDSGNIKFSFAAATVASGITAVAGTNRYTMITGTGGTITKAVNTSGAAGVRYAIFTDTGASIPSGQPVTINTNTGAITVGNALAAGTYHYVVMAENATGVTGQYDFYIDVAAS